MVGRQLATFLLGDFAYIQWRNAKFVSGSVGLRMVVGIQKCLVDVTGVAWSQKYPRKIWAQPTYESMMFGRIPCISNKGTCFPIHTRKR